MNELDPEHRPLAQPDAGSQTPPPLETIPASGAEHGVRGGTGAAGDHPRDTRPDRATRFVETTRGILSYAQLAPLLAERVTAAETGNLPGGFQIRPLDESLLLDLHARICGDLVPDWAGRWRSIEVVVGKLRPRRLTASPDRCGIMPLIFRRAGRRLRGWFQTSRWNF